MTTPEEPRPSVSGAGELKLVVPSLLPPYDGVFEEAYAEYIDNPETFLVALRHRMHIDNPELETLFDSVSEAGIPQSDDALKWIAIYYEMFARSLRRVGLPMISISDRKFITRNNIGILDSSRTLLEALKDPQTLEENFEDRREKLRRRRTRDEEFSPELRKFWHIVDQYVEVQAEKMSSPVLALTPLIPLNLMQELLQSQNDEYSLIGQDIHGLI